MDKFCIITNGSKDIDYELANFIKDFLLSKGKSCVIATDYGRDGINGKNITDVLELPKDTQCAIVLGGDGTIIQAANDLADEDIPILGVNLGTLGFLADVEKQNILHALEQLLNDEYIIEKRMMLEGFVTCDQKREYCGVALNDFVISKGGYYHLVTIKVFVNDELIDTYIADGLIISTPTGSTGYNLSAGGPVMAPQIEAVIITPICPHSLNNRSLVISSEDKIDIEIGCTKEIHVDKSVLILDGRILNEMVTGDRITIHKAKTNTKIIKLNGISFFQIFRNKLGIDKE